MGVYAEYLDRQLPVEQLNIERKSQLKRIATLRGGRDLLVYAAGFNAPDAPYPVISLINQDFLAFNDQLSNLRGKALDLLLKTPGGSGEVAEQIVRQVRGKYDHVAVIIPGTAKSAGTIMALSADEILMGPTSALGPIDAQMIYQGKVFSADALIKGFEKIKKEVEEDKKLNLAYVPILQQISPGELQHAQNALDFAKDLVSKWLAKYKFRDWSTHSSSNAVVTAEEKVARATEIAQLLCDHGKWLTHNRSIMLEDLREMGLRITDYSENAQLNDAISRYYVLLQMTFEATNIYKVIETPDSQIYRMQMPQTPILPVTKVADIVMVDIECPKCKTKARVQADLGEQKPLQPGAMRFPKDGRFRCLKCSHEIDLNKMKDEIQTQNRRPIVT